MKGVFARTSAIFPRASENCMNLSIQQQSRRPRFAAALACLLTAGCVVGPNFEKPAAPDVTEYTLTPVAITASSANIPAGDAQRFDMGRDVPGDWWTLFHSKPLNDLIEESLANNHDLKAAQAALQAAHENVLAQKGAYYPQITGSFSATRQSQSALLAPTPSNNAFQYNLFTPQVNVSYVPDVFGLNRRTVESLKAQEQDVHYQLIAAHIALSANVVNAAVQEASLRAQVDLTRKLIDINSHVLQILQYQFSKGYASRLDVATQEAQLAQTAATLPPLLKQLAQQQDALAVLVGRYPSRAPTEKFDLATLQLPQDLPVSLPSVLVEQRPDVLQAEANARDANAKIGIAVANRLPNIQLTADAGSTALAIGQIFASGSGFWGIGANLTAPIFDGGSLLHQERAARAIYVQASQQYRSTVLTAFQNVADTLVALQQDADALKAAASAGDATKVSLDLSQRQLQDGHINTLALLAAEQAYQQAQINLVQAEATRYADTAALYLALGGGWWHRADLNPVELNGGKDGK
jgi:NodT family efflux transporter outer membrane factor (OMF) lipoprotein